MWLDILAISLWGGIVSLDTTAAFQIMISHPLIACSLVGLILGNFPLGFAIGIILELVWLNELPLGAANFSEGNIGATAAAAIAILTLEQTSRPIPSVGFALILSILISSFGGHLVTMMRNINGKLYQDLINANKLTIKKIVVVHLKGITFAFLMGFLLTATFTTVFAIFILPRLITILPKSVDAIIQPLCSAFLGVGCGILVFMFAQHKYWWLLLIGAAGGILIKV